MRKVAVGMPQGSGGMHQADLERIEEEEAENRRNTPATGTATGKRHSVGTGAMDDWQVDDDGPKKKKTKMKTVEKMLMDERGYMITTLVEEEVTDDEEDVRAAQQAKQQRMQAERLKAATSPSKDTKAKPKVTKGKPQPANQTGMMSFFGKK